MPYHCSKGSMMVVLSVSSWAERSTTIGSEPVTASLRREVMLTYSIAVKEEGLSVKEVLTWREENYLPSR